MKTTRLTKMKRLFLFFALFLIILSSQTIAATYADIDIKANSDGSLSIDGLTNYEPFVSFEEGDFLNYDGKYWVLNITTDEVFSDAIYKITLPENVVVNYLRVPDLLTIDNKNGRMTVVGTAHNQKMNIIVQYTADKKGGSWWFFLILIAIGSGLLVWAYMMKSPSHNSYTYKGLTPRQKQIFELVVKNTKGITQAEIETITKLPKSSLSRNIDSLVRKELIHKEQSGMSNKLFLVKK